MAFPGLTRRSRRLKRARQLYDRAVTQARQPGFYRDLGVPDTVDGRFDAIVLHVVLIMRRLRREGAAGAELEQALFDVMMEDMDRSLREMGVGDLAVGRRIKTMARAFYGRFAAYEKALTAADGSLGAALGRNLYGTVSPAPGEIAAVAAYMAAATAAIEAQPVADLMAGEARFAALPLAGEA